MPLVYEDYTIGWIAALPHELAPARALLDEEHESLEGLPGDNNTYTLGRMGKHNVVIAALPIMGTNAAANAAKDLIRTFPNVRFGLMVGIGGGVPTGPEDVRLGDIVVSAQQGRSGGVLQYDFGTEVQCETGGNLEQEDFVIKSFLREPHTSLQTAVANLKSKSLVDGYGYHDIYEAMLEKKPRMKQTFKKPTTDILYKPEYVHRAGDDCSACDTSQVIDRSPRDEPVVHYGLIGSGNQVIRNALYRDKLYRKEKIICFEMEAAGLMKDFECMVVRGICDYCDSHKNKDWQPYAAAVAAAYAKELLSVLPVQQVKAMPKSIILDTINNNLCDIAARTEKIITAQESFELRVALGWIDAPDPETNFLDAQKRKDPETGTWIADSSIYIQWKTSLKRHLWLHGKAGCGKSVLTATAIPDIRRHCTIEGAAFAMFYFTFSDTRKQSWQDCLKSLVVQLVTREPAVSILIQAHQASKGSSPNEGLLRRLLFAATEPYRQVFVVIDALDESPQDVNGDGTIRSIVLDSLASLSRDAPHIKFFLTSRDLPDIRESMEALEASSVPMVTECVDRDIMKYVTNQLAKDKKLSRWSDEIKDNVKTTLTAKADGMFRWAYCQLHQLRTLPLTRPKDIERALTALPKTLDETYERMLSGIDQNLQTEVLILLRWLAYAQRPLSLHEITETITINLNQEGSVVDTNNRPQPEEIANLLAGLVVTKYNIQHRGGCGEVIDESYSDLQDDDYDDDDDDDEENRAIDHEAHFSVKEYLESPRSISLPFHLSVNYDQQFLLNCCLAYLMHYSESRHRLGTDQDLTIFPLLEYAVESWFKHYVDTGDIQYVVSFLTSEKALDSWSYAYRILLHNGSSWRFYKRVPHGLYFASDFGLYTVAKSLIELNADINASRDDYLGLSLIAACRRGHEKLAELLIAAGANVNEEEKDGDDDTPHLYIVNPLFCSSRNGNLRVVRMLKEAGVNCNARYLSFMGCMKVAAENGHERVLRYLIDIAEDLDVQGGDLSELLGVAARFRHSHLVKILIDDYGVNPKAQYGGDGSLNALKAAASSIFENERVIKMLIEDYGVDVNLESGGSTALSRAVEHCCLLNVKILLDAGADPDSQRGFYGNALQAAAFGGSIDILEELIAAGADPNAQSEDGTSPLMLAAAAGRVDIIEMLTERGANINMSDYTGRNAVSYAAIKTNIVAYKQLIATRTCNLNIQDRLRMTILDYVCISGSAEMLKTFLETEPHEISGNSLPSVWSPWHWACRSGTFELLEILSNAGFHTWVVETDIPAARWTPLDIAIYCNNYNLVSEEGKLLEDYDWRSLCQSGIVLEPTSGHGEVILHRENSIRRSEMRYGGGDYGCEGCLSDICGIIFRRQGSDLEYCFMCKHSFEVIYPGCVWEYAWMDKKTALELDWEWCTQ